jgi:hypothetical protein
VTAERVAGLASTSSPSSYLPTRAVLRSGYRYAISGPVNIKELVFNLTKNFWGKYKKFRFFTNIHEMTYMRIQN